MKESGALAYALCVTRAFGVTPLRMEPQQTRVYRAHALYGKVLVTTLSIMTMAALSLDYYQNIGDIKGMVFGESNTDFPSWLVHLFCTVFIVNIGLWTGRGRMARIAAHFKQMKETNFRVNETNKKQSREVKRIAAMFALLMLQVFLHVLVIIEKIQTFATDHKAIPVICLYQSYFIMVIMGVALMSEVMVLMYALHSSMETLNEELELILNGIPKIKPLKASEEATLLRIGSMYISIGDSVAQCSNEDGGLMLLILLYSSFKLAGSICTTVEGIISAELSTYQLLFAIAWTLANLLMVISLVEPCHLFQKEVDRMRVLVSRLMYRTQRVGEPSTVAMDVLCKQLILDPPTFILLGVFIMSRSLLANVISGVAACLMFMIQLRGNNEDA